MYCLHSSLLASNPFVDAYVESDLIGKLIFISLVALSVVSWSLVIYKVWLTRRVREESQGFRKSFFDQRETPLGVNPPPRSHAECPNAFYIVYDVIKAKTLELLEKNHRVASGRVEGACATPQASFSLTAQTAYLSSSDVDLLASCAHAAISSLTKYLDKYLYVLSTIVTLAPFLGLLGTVYGILTTFSGMQAEASMGSNQVILGGLSLALTTTVIGLIDAIPALIGYNYLKNVIQSFDTDMGRFATDVLATVELHYRKVDLQ